MTLFLLSSYVLYSKTLNVAVMCDMTFVDYLNRYSDKHVTGSFVLNKVTDSIYMGGADATCSKWHAVKMHLIYFFYQFKFIAHDIPHQTYCRVIALHLST